MRMGKLVLLVTVIIFCAPALAYDWSANPGDGSPENPYQISTPEHLTSIGDNPDLLEKHFILTADIDCYPGLPGNQVFTQSIIGGIYQPYGYVENAFEGHFDGNHHTIRNLYFIIQDIYKMNVGLFSKIGPSAFVQNLNIFNMNILAEGVFQMGGITGFNEGTIRNCSVDLDASVTISGYYVGSIAGFSTGSIDHCTGLFIIDGDLQYAGGFVGANSGVILESSSDGMISSFDQSSMIGGFVGHNSNTISKCFSFADVSGTVAIGGFAGLNSYRIDSCYSEGTVTGHQFIGGFVGTSGSDGDGSTISSSYSAAQVTATANMHLETIGGFAGDNSGTLFLCYWDTQAAQMDVSNGAISKTTAEMKTRATFEGWGFDEAWVLNDGIDYPRLAWQNTPGSPIHDNVETYGGGNGTPEDPYRISEPRHIAALASHREDFSKHFILQNDIEVELPILPPWGFCNFNPIGTPANPYTGTFDGRGHTISNLYYHGKDNEFAGLFGCVESINDRSAKIMNLKLLSPSVIGEVSAGALVGYLSKAEVRNCGTENGFAIADREAGGLVGRMNGGTIITSYASGSVSSYEMVFGKIYRGFGGLVGFSSNGVIDSCYARGRLNCRPVYEYGQVWGTAGGLVGQANEGSIINSFAAMENESNSGYVEGLVGAGSAGCFLSFWDSMLSGIEDGSVGDPKTTAELMDPASFIGWGDNVWTLDPGQDYPHLAWENAPGDPIVDQPRTYGGGTGTPDNPYQIKMLQHLETLSRFRQDFDKSFILANDINMFKGPVWDPQNNSSIGTKGCPFTGSFDGNGHTLSNFYYHGSDSYIGIFGYLSSPMPDAVKDLTVEYSWIENFDGGGYAGALAGCIEKTEIANCRINSPLIYHGSHTGGLAGCASGALRNCTVQDCTIYGSQSVGGLVGWFQCGTMANCTASGQVGGLDLVGGLAGRTGHGGGIVIRQGDGQITTAYDLAETSPPDDITITNCAANAYVYGENFIGGFVGSHSSGVISRSAALGSVQCEDRYGGGFAGAVVKADISDSYANIDLTADWNSGGFCGSAIGSQIARCYTSGTADSVYGQLPRGFLAYNWNASIHSCYYHQPLMLSSDGGAYLTDVQMKRKISFAGWDFLGESTNGQNEIWRMCADGVAYPRLSWEFAQQGDFACADGVDLNDLLALADHWLMTEAANATTFSCAADANNDRRITLQDLAVLSENWP